MVDTKEEVTVDSSESSTATCVVAASSTSNEPNSTVYEGDDVVPVDKPKPDKDLIVEAFQYLHQGKRHLIVSDYKSAVPSLERACEIFDSCYGTGAAECGEAYLNYGIALFELSRLEEGIFDDGVHVENQISSEEDDEDNDDNEDEEDEQEKEADEQNDTEKEENEAQVKEPEESVSDEKADIDLTQPSTSKSDSSTPNGDKSDDEDADCASNFEIAWEVLSLARDIFTRNEHSRENNLNLAEALQKLAEISIEWENNENAIYLLNECLECRKESLQPDDRLIAVTYHYLGVAFSCKCDYDSANSCFENALNVIQLRLKHLKEKNIDLLDQLEKDSHHREILQLEGLIPELQLKIEDQKEQMQSKFKTLKSLEEETKKEEAKQIQAQPIKPVNNISHLIKRKREPEEGEKNSEISTESLKKVCAESVDSTMTEISATTTDASN